MNKNSNFLVVGTGVSGLGVIDFFKEKNINYSVLKLNKTDSYANITNKINNKINYAVVSAGFKTNDKLIKKIKRKKIEIVGELALVQKFLKGKFVGVIGTNGKTTTSYLIWHILSSAQKNATISGNCGKSILQTCKNSNSQQINVVEISSFMMEKSTNFACNVGVLLNLQPDHIKHHKTISNYYNCKLKLIENISKNNFCVLNADDENVFNLTRNISCKKIYFSTLCKVDGAYVKNGFFEYCGEKICATSQTKLIGLHNHANICAAICVAKIFGVSNQDIASAIESFEPVKHRLNLVCVKDGKEFINDSKATNLNSTLSALKAVCGKKVLILGGQGKGENFENLFKEQTFDVEKIVCYGESGKKILKQISKVFEKQNLFYVWNFEQAIKKAKNLTQSGQKCLLSPGCASFDQHKNFEHRGEEFERVVNKT